MNPPGRLARIGRTLDSLGRMSDRTAPSPPPPRPRPLPPAPCSPPNNSALRSCMLHLLHPSRQSRGGSPSPTQHRRRYSAVRAAALGHSIRSEPRQGPAVESDAMAAAAVDEEGVPRLRRFPTLSESSLSDLSDGRPPSPTEGKGKGPSVASAPDDDLGLGKNQSLTLRGIVGSTAFRRRLSRQSSLTWGHRPSPLVGASCFLFLLPIPLWLRACCPAPAALLACVAVSSYLSDHAYTGLESWAHTADRVLAPLAFVTNLIAIHATCGPAWTAMALPPLKCHVMANYHAKRGEYERFVFWHSMWHAVGAGLIVVALTVNRNLGHCWEDGSGWEGMIREQIAIF
ncbi:hypothetical protein ACHAWF_001701 [Thalassiosira exigua]